MGETQKLLLASRKDPDLRVRQLHLLECFGVVSNLISPGQLVPQSLNLAIQLVLRQVHLARQPREC